MARTCNDPRAGSDMKYMTRHTSTFILSRSWIHTQNVPLNMGKNILNIHNIFIFYVANQCCQIIFFPFCCWPVLYLCVLLFLCCSSVRYWGGLHLILLHVWATEVQTGRKKEKGSLHLSYVNLAAYLQAVHIDNMTYYFYSLLLVSRCSDCFWNAIKEGV